MQDPDNLVVGEVGKVYEGTSETMENQKIGQLPSLF
jgi:hypothetical protein